MMKSQFIVVICILAGVISCYGASPCNLPTKEQIDKLATAVCKTPPSSIDITVNEKLFRKPMSEEQIRKMFEDVDSRMGRTKDKQFVQMNTDRTLKEQTVGVNTRDRVRLTGDRQRIDRVTLRPDEWDQNDIPSAASDSERNNAYDATIIIAGPNEIRCIPATKTMEIRQRRKKEIENEDVTNVVEPAMLALRGLLTEQKDAAGGTCIASVEKLNTLAKTGKVGDMEVSICPDPNAAQSKVRIELKGINGIVHAIFICDKDDYSRAYYTEIRMPVKGKPIYIKECSNFDLQGIPRNVAVSEYDRDGSVKEKKMYRVLDVNLNPVIPAETFEFNPPEEYQIVEVARDGVTRKVIREKGGIEGAANKLLTAYTAKDIETVKGMLGHKAWQVRRLALQLLESLLAQKPDELREAASRLKDDESPEVREKAQKILARK